MVKMTLEIIKQESLNQSDLRMSKKNIVNGDADVISFVDSFEYQIKVESSILFYGFCNRIGSKEIDANFL